MSTEKVKFIKAEYFEEPTTISNVVEYLSSYMHVRGSESVDGSRSVLWSKFISSDYNDLRNYPEQQCEAILMVGTEGAVQIYKLGMDGKLCLLFSCAIAKVDAATVLPSPNDPAKDQYIKERPLLASVCESRVSFHSMCTGRCIKEVTHKTDFVDVCATSRLIVASSRTNLVLLSTVQLTILLILPNCRASVSPWVSVAHHLSEYWLTYSEQSVHRSMISVGGDLSDQSEKPYVLSLLDMKKKMTPVVVVGDDGDSERDNDVGVVSIVSVDGILSCVRDSNPVVKEGRVLRALMVAHFIAHQWTPVARIEADCTGTVLMTTCQQGIFCHLFKVVPHPTSVTDTAVVHLYRLYRGETPRTIVSMVISKDCRLAAAASDHGTVHVWPISSYGGALSVRTHCQGHVVNRLSRLERSAGMQEHQVTRPHHSHHMPLATVISSPPPAPITGSNHSLHLLCPRLPPMPLPVTLSSYAQLKPLSTLPPGPRPLSLVPFFSSGHPVSCPGSFTRTEWLLMLSPDLRLLQYALNISPDWHPQSQSPRTDLDGPFSIEKRSNLQWRIPVCAGPNNLDYSQSSALAHTHTRGGQYSRTSVLRRDTQSALLQSLATDLSESLEQLYQDTSNVVTPQCWFSNIEISSQISFTSSIRRQEKFSISTYQGKEPLEARLEAIQKSPSVSSQLSNNSWRGDDRPREEGSSQPVGVPHSEQRIQICNSFCGSSISDGVPDCGDNVLFTLAHAIQDEDSVEDVGPEQWDEPRTSYIEYMTKDMNHVRLRRVSGSFSSDIGRLPLLSSSPAHADIPEEMFSSRGDQYGKAKKQVKRQDKKKRKS